MSHYDNATLAATAIMALFGVPWLLTVSPAILQGIAAGDWSVGCAIVEQGLHVWGMLIGLLISVILLVGAVLE